MRRNVQEDRQTLAICLSECLQHSLFVIIFK